MEHTVDGRTHSRPTVAGKIFLNIPDGLFQALPRVKDVLKQYRANGPCPDCASDGTPQEPPRKKLKLVNMPKCCLCMFKAITDFGDGSVARECA